MAAARCDAHASDVAADRLAAFAWRVHLVPAATLLAGPQLGWFGSMDEKTIPLLILGLAVPLQMLARVLGFLGRDSHGADRSVRPLGRHRRARVGAEPGIRADLDDLHQEPGVREQPVRLRHRKHAARRNTPRDRASPASIAPSV